MNKAIILLLFCFGLVLCQPLVTHGASRKTKSRSTERDAIRINKKLSDGTKITIMEGSENETRSEWVESTRITTNTVRIKKPAPMVLTLTNVVVVPVGVPHKASLTVLPAIFTEHFKPVCKFSDVIDIQGRTNIKAIFTTEREFRWEAPNFTISLAEAFVGSRKFDVLERARLAEVIKEIDFGESRYGDVSKVVPVGRALNAEYVVLPEIEVIHLLSEMREIPYVGVNRLTLKGKMVCRLRVVNTGTSKVVAAFTETIEVEHIIKPNEPFIETEWTHLVLALYKRTGQRLMHRTVEAIYPLKVLDVVDGHIVINRGSDAVDLDDEFDVYKLGKAYTDPDTGEFLGQREVKVARVKVSRITPKFSEATIVDDGKVKMNGGDEYLCRETGSSIEKKVTIERRPINW